jgi:hypothetical protein
MFGSSGHPQLQSAGEKGADSSRDYMKAHLSFVRPDVIRGN